MPAGPPPGVAERLAALSALYVPERVVDAHARLERERSVINQRFEIAVARRLRELRALCELARHLQQVQVQVQVRGADKPRTS